MTEYAIIDDGVIVAFRDFDEEPGSLAGKPYRQFLPVVVTNPDYDPVTQIKTGPVVTIGETEVTRVWTVTDKSQAQIDAETAARRDEIASRLDQAEDVLRAILSVIVDEFNSHSTRDQAMKDATAAATSLANFQTRMAAIAVIPQRTLSDLRNAVRQRLGT